MMSNETMRHQVLSNKSAELIRNIIDSDIGDPVSLSSQESPKFFNQHEESVIHKNQIMWTIKKSVLFEKEQGKYIESPYVEVDSLGISSLRLGIYPKGKNKKFIPNSDLFVHFRSLPENILVLCQMSIVEKNRCINFKKVQIKNSSDIKENKIDFDDFCPFDKFAYLHVDEMIIIQCRIKLLSKTFKCISGKSAYTVNKIPELNSIKFYEDILKDGIYSDVSLKVESCPSIIKSHKFILASASPSFRVLLKVNYGNMQELHNEEYSIITHLLKFMYSGNFQIFDFNHAKQLYAASCKYEILNLKDLCSAYLIAGLTEGNISCVWDLSREHNDKQLFEACTTFIKSHNITAETFFQRKHF